MSQPVLTFLMSCVVGGFLGFVYDVFRITRIAIKTGKIVIFIEDILFFLISTVVSFTFIVVDNKGEFRGMLLIGEVIGAVVYFLTISVVLLKCAKWIIDAIKWILCLFWRIIKMMFHPIVLIYRTIHDRIMIKRVLLSLNQLTDAE